MRGHFPIELPADVSGVVDDLVRMPGVVSVVLGGSRALGTAHEASDWDLGVYYRGDVDLSALRRRGEVHPPGAWGRIMNGGAWLSVQGVEIDVILRDAERVEEWTAKAEEGWFEVDALLGYLAGAPTYLVAAERHAAVVLCGEAPRRIDLPARLAESGATRWRSCSRFSLEQALARATRGDTLGALGQAARGAIEEAHARLCARGVWALNEKRIVSDAGLEGAVRLFQAPPPISSLVEWTERLAATLED